MKTNYKKCLLIFFALFLLASSGRAQTLTDLIARLSNEKNGNQKVILLKDIGAYYQKQRAFAKSQEYFEKALQQEIKEHTQDKFIVSTRGSIAHCQIQQRKYTQAIRQYQAILNYAHKYHKEKQELNTLNELSYLNTLNKNYDASLQYTEQVLQLNKVKNNHEGVVQTYNNLGYLHHIKGDNKKSLESYQVAVNLSKKYAETSKNNVEKAVLLTNMGVAYSHLRDFKTAREYFSQGSKNIQAYQKAGQASQKLQLSGSQLLYKW